MSRFVVRTVTGYPINPAAARTAGNALRWVSFLVLDSAVNYRLMGEFTGRVGHQSRLLAAHELADRLERECVEAEARAA